MSTTRRQGFLDYVRQVPGARPVVSPFLPHAPVLESTLRYLGVSLGDDRLGDEIRLSQALDYEPMFMTDCPGLIFPWTEDKSRSSRDEIALVIHTRTGEWLRKIPRAWTSWGGGDAGFPVQSEADHEKLVQVCEGIHDREAGIRSYFRTWRRRVGDAGVIVIGHPHVTWLAYQIGQESALYHYRDYPEAYARSMDAICQAALFVFGVAMEEGIDFMSESSAGVEFTSPALFDTQDLPYLRVLSDWTHERGGLFWYHNCGRTQEMILSGRFSRFGADVIETLSPPPEGNIADLGECRRGLDASICSKGNLSLILLRDGAIDEVERTTRDMVRAVEGYPHICSTADAVLMGTPPENFVAFVRAARVASDQNV